VIVNAPLISIGQLGDIFDPVRIKGDSGNIRLSRSGGRTLRIGQTDRFDATTNSLGLWDGSSSSASREWTTWRLVDIFETSDAVQQDGRININSVVRDGGAALRTALYGYNFQAIPDSDPSLANQPLDDNSLTTLVNQVKARVVNDGSTYTQFANTAGPIAERGELSEMPIFNTTSTGSTTYYLAPGVDTMKVDDRGREELFRRAILPL
jgi:hypothetical protein